MKALDTCVLARFFVADDPVQTPLAEREIELGGFIPITVVLELAWLLRSRYGYDRALIADSLAELVNLPNIVLANEASFAWIGERLRAGADIADLIHLVAANGCEAFVTFDNMVQQVGPDAPMIIELLA